MSRLFFGLRRASWKSMMKIYWETNETGIYLLNYVFVFRTVGYAITPELTKLPDCRLVYVQTEKVDINNYSSSNQESKSNAYLQHSKKEKNQETKINVGSVTIYRSKTNIFVDSVWVNCEQCGFKQCFNSVEIYQLPLKFWLYVEIRKGNAII